MSCEPKPAGACTRLMGVVLFVVLVCGACLSLGTGCSSTRLPSNQNSSLYPEGTLPPFPHPDGWVGNNGEGSGTHGSWVLQGGYNVCLSCHPLDPNGGVEEGAPACRSHHTNFPHDANWPDTHGTAFLADRTQCATSCHGEDLKGGQSGKSCYQHHNYPHPEGWEEANNHGPAAYGEKKNDCNLGRCHGPTFEGREGVSDSCYAHHEFPHVSENWTAPGRASEHAALFIESIRHDEVNECTGCHGEDYDRDLGGHGCTNVNCHPNGVTHREGWYSENPPEAEHGTYFSTESNLSSLSQNTNCARCHNSPVAFTDGQPQNSSADCFNCHLVHWRQDRDIPMTQDRATLANASYCYTCHVAYPHVSYEIRDEENNVANTIGWGPSSEENPDHFFWGHVYYLMRNPLFQDASGVNPGSWFGMGINDGDYMPAIENTCAGRTEGMCHYNGYRSEDNDTHSDLCTSYCHKI